MSSTGLFDYKTLVGTWKLTSWVMHFIDEGTTEPYFGPNPQGYITFDSNQRMIVIITQSNRASHNLATITKDEEANLFETMLSYSGKVVLIQENKGYFDIDISYNQTWTGEKQNREFIIKDNKLQIIVGPQIGINGKNITAIMSWDKV